MQVTAQRDTPGERAVRSALHRLGLRFTVDRRPLPEVRRRADVLFRAARVAVFVDGCFWHGHPDFFTPGKSGPYWDAKIARTQERDALANDALREAGWTVIRFWDFEVEDDVTQCARTVIAAIRNARSLVTA